VASPLSRAVDTADLVIGSANAPRVLREEWREINGDMANAQRRRRSELQTKYGGGGWDCSQLPSEEDESWTVAMEDPEGATLSPP
jgi:hypothetical protein